MGERFLNINIFSKKKKYASIAVSKNHSEKDIPDGIMTQCSKCKKIWITKALKENLNVCPNCQAHLYISPRERLEQLLDAETFEEWNQELMTVNPLNFEGYLEKIQSDQIKTGLNEAVLTGKGLIDGYPIGIAIMDAGFRMGSMGSVVGEKITRTILRCIEERLPFVIFTASGGARMQEGILSLMQMAKTSAALKQLHDAGILYIVVMTNPTTGGVSASFASLGDIHLAEPGALIGFAGRRIIEQTIKEKLPDDFQTAEFLLKCGQLDAIVERKNMKQTLSTLLKIHEVGGDSHE